MSPSVDRPVVRKLVRKLLDHLAELALGSSTRLSRVLLLLIGISVAPTWAQDAKPEPQEPGIASASDEGERAMLGFQIPTGMQAKLFAAEPQLANPVAFALDERGRVFVCESFRQEKGVEDNRNHMDWLVDDLAARTLEDRLAYFQKHLGERIQEYTREDDRLRLLEDRDGDGVADFDSVFAKGFNGILEGTGAGVLIRRGNVYYTCIPSLWLLNDDDQDGQADRREELQRGFGIRVAFRGHDMHGLCMGPDGRVYFSIGDRGYNFTTAEGVHYERPDTGAVFRCQPDGSQLEVFAYGLRNPQELAFDQYGNLFTGDNNSDGGDRARWVNVVKGSDTGWRMYYQYLSDRGPWNRERLWHPAHSGQAAYIVPPIANLGDGPSGLVYYPGVGLDPKYQNHFLMCDFRGAAGQSGVRAFAVEPQGAFFKLANSEQFVWSLLATDLAFDYEGRLYVSDWVHGWSGLGKGRIYTFTDPGYRRPEGAVVMKQDWSQQPTERLLELLNDPDQRIRLEAQFTLADRVELEALQAATASDQPLLKRLHGIWGLGQLGQREAELMESLLPLLADSQSEVRAQAARVLGDGKLLAAAWEPLAAALTDTEPRVQAYAALSLARYTDTRAIPAVVKMLAQHQDADPVIRHAGVMALSAGNNSEPLLSLRKHESVAVRRAAVVALRRLQNPRVAEFLQDTDLSVAVEAARAIYDDQIQGAREELARAITRPITSDALPEIADSFYRRAIFANLAVGTAEAAHRVVEFAGNSSVPGPLQQQAIIALRSWSNVPVLDLVTGQYRPQLPRDPSAVAAMLRPQVEALLKSSPQISAAMVELAAVYGVTGAEERLQKVLHDTSAEPAAQAAALEAVSQLKVTGWEEIVQRGLTAEAPEVRMAAQRTLARTSPRSAVPAIVQAMQQGTIPERQQAIRLLARMRSRQAAPALLAEVERLGSENPPPLAVQLDLIEVAHERAEQNAAFSDALAKYEAQHKTDDPLGKYQVCLEGGDAQRGQAVFAGRSELSCRRCHNVEGELVSVGPNLAKVARENTREYLLESIVHPNQKIAKGFETTVVITNDGRTFSGILREETDDSILLVLADGQLQRIAKADIEERVIGKSAMPEDLLKQLSLGDLRDLVEYLSTLK